MSAFVCPDMYTYIMCIYIYRYIYMHVFVCLTVVPISNGYVILEALEALVVLQLPGANTWMSLSRFCVKLESR